MKTKLLFLGALFLMISSLFAQSADTNARQISKTKKIIFKGKEIVINESVSSHFGENNISNWINNNIEMLVYQNYISIHGFEIIKITDSEKSKKFKSIHSLHYANKFHQQPNFVGLKEFSVLDYPHSGDDEQLILLDDNSVVKIFGNKLLSEGYSAYLEQF